MKIKAAFLSLLFSLLGLSSSLLLAELNKAQETDTDAVLSSQETKIVDKWRGTWDVMAMRNMPQPAQEVNYVETFEWVLDGRYLRSETSRKSDGGKSMSIFWYDLLTESYRFVIYDASGLAVELPAPTWNESTQTMNWKSGFFSPISYTGHATFTDPDRIQWKSLWKDWKGTVIMDIEGTSIRRK